MYVCVCVCVRTYVCVCYPSKGTGIPHLRSRLIQCGFRLSHNHDDVIWYALVGQVPTVRSRREGRMEGGREKDREK